MRGEQRCTWARLCRAWMSRSTLSQQCADASISDDLRPSVYSRGMRVRFPEPQCPSGHQRCARPRRRRDPFEQHRDRMCSDHTSWPYLCSSSRSFKGAWRGGLAFRSRSHENAGDHAVCSCICCSMPVALTARTASNDHPSPKENAGDQLRVPKTRSR